MSTEELLKELRIDRAQREDSSKQAPRWLWIAGGVLVALCICAAVAWPRAKQGVAANIVKASARAVDNSAAVLQATGYVTPRRQATVSAQMVGTLTEVLIEEGDRVEKGQVLARLDGVVDVGHAGPSGMSTPPRLTATTTGNSPYGSHDTTPQPMSRACE